MNTKVFIIGSIDIDKLPVAKKIIELNDSLSFGEITTNNPEYKGIKNGYYTYLEPADIFLAFENNAFLTVKTGQYISEGITNDTFYNNDIFVMDFELFNNLSLQAVKNNDILIVWLDTKKCANQLHRKQDLIEIKYIEEKLKDLPVLYYIDDTADVIADDIVRYIEAPIEGRYAIIEENN